MKITRHEQIKYLNTGFIIFMLFSIFAASFIVLLTYCVYTNNINLFFASLLISLCGIITWKCSIISRNCFHMVAYLKNMENSDES
jgi:hypothetical protein